ncbi:MAG: spermidine synthase [Proteobacteria bacterium]|nr:spermidine synthase [Pseudomonadota bacterium]
MLPLVQLILFLSGSSALLFEALWFRQAGLTFGNSIWASSLVLSSFMAGLALGNGLAARFGARLERPFRAYALLELGVGAAGIALVAFLPLFTSALAPLFRLFFDLPWVLQPLRFSLAFALLLVPAAAMGATLPVLVKALAASQRDYGRMLGRLYGWNTLGAVAGALSSELLWIPAFGVLGSGAVALLGNTAAALLALWASRRLGSGPAHAPAPAEPLLGPRPPAIGRLFAAFLSGAILLGLEVVWFRFLSLFVPTTAVAFAWMLAVVLAGIGLGSLAAGAALGRWPRIHHAASAAASAAGLATIAAYAAFGGILDGVGGIKSTHPHVVFLLSTGLMGGTAFGSGVLFTWIGKQLHEALGAEVRTTGLLTLANTFGSMLGPLVTGFWLLPRFGMERSLFALAAGYLLVAAALSGRRAPVPALAAAGLAAGLVLFPFGLMESRYLDVISRRLEGRGEQVVTVREGLLETIHYARRDWLGEPLAYRLVTDGYSMSGSGLHSKRYMSLFAYLPAALHEAPRQALLISYGVGTTARSLADLPSLERIHVVDISPDILELSTVVFPDPETHPLEDPRVEVFVEDGRYYLATREEQFDLITSEPPPPAFAGVVNLYTREYFALIRSRLREGGLVSYWLPVQQLLEPDARAIVRAFCQVFDDCTLWEGTPQDWILLGSRGGRPAPLASFERLFQEPATAEPLANLGIESPELLASLFLADASTLRDWVDATPPLVDNYPHRAPRPTRLWRQPPPEYRELLDPRQARQRFAESRWVQTHLPASLRAATAPAFELRGYQTGHLLRTRGVFRLGPLHHSLTQTSLRTLPLWLLDSDAAHQAVARRLEARGVSHPELIYHRAARAMADRDFARAAELYAQLDPDDFPNLSYFRLAAEALAGRAETAHSLAEELRNRREGAPGPAFWRTYESLFGSLR